MNQIIPLIVASQGRNSFVIAPWHVFTTSRGRDMNSNAWCKATGNPNPEKV